MSPFAQHARSDGMPCTTSSLIEMHTLRGKHATGDLVALERRGRAALPRHLLGDAVELGGGDPRRARCRAARPAPRRRSRWPRA